MDYFTDPLGWIADLVKNQKVKLQLDQERNFDTIPLHYTNSLKDIKAAVDHAVTANAKSLLLFIDNLSPLISRYGCYEVTKWIQALQSQCSANAHLTILMVLPEELISENDVKSLEYISNVMINLTNYPEHSHGLVIELLHKRKHGKIIRAVRLSLSKDTNHL